MCGIAGELHLDGSVIKDELDLLAMRDALVHRGPDGAGLWLSSDRRAGLVHRRLSIVDLGPEAAQPMGNENGSIQVTFNGEIYNHLELRSQLQSRGHRFKTDHSDTEVLVHGFEEWGIDGLLERLMGMFAFGLYNENDGSLYLVRDRVGIKPLYFTFSAGILLFASEIKALLKHNKIKAKLSHTATYHYYSFLTTPAPLTMFQGIYKIPAGFFLKMPVSGKLEASRYWDALPGRGIDASEIAGLSVKAREEFYVKGVRSRLEKAVERRMMADVPYGAFLSGGIDSSSNIALMAKHTDKAINTFTVGFSDYTYLNELGHARKVAKHFGTEHNEVEISATDMMGYLDEMVYQQDEPIADWVCIPLHFVSKLAHDKGIKVVQVGEGADEQFAGYQHYQDYLDLYSKYWRPFRRYLPGVLQRFAAYIAGSAARGIPRLETYADIIQRAAYDKEHFWTGATLLWESQKGSVFQKNRFESEEIPGFLKESGLLPASYLEHDSSQIIRSFRERLDQFGEQTDVLNRMIYNEFKLRLPELLLMRVDKISMGSSLEARVPFLDHELVEFTMDIGMDDKLKTGAKSILKKAVRGLIPDEVIDRPKMGFGAPMKDWLKGEFGRQAEESILKNMMVVESLVDRDAIKKQFKIHRGGKQDHSGFLWALYNQSEFIVQHQVDF